MFLLLVIPAYLTWLTIDQVALEKSLAWLIGIMTWAIDLLLTPINLLFDQYMPDLTGQIAFIDQMFVYISQYIAYIFDATLVLSQASFNLIIGYYVMAFAVPMAAWLFKLPFKWYKQIS